jgi:hypothetical protein
VAILSKQIGWSQEANLIYELIKQTNRLNQILPGNQPSYGVKRMSQMIGWSTESKLYYEWLRQLDKVTQHYGCPDCTPPAPPNPPPPGYVQALTFRVDNRAGNVGGTAPGYISGFPPFTMYVDWGDGSALQAYASDVDQFLSHVFTSNSIFDVKVYLQDPLVIYSVILIDTLGNFHLLEVDISAMEAATDIDLSGNQLSSTQVNNVLAQFVSNGAYSGALNINNQTPPAPPTGQGIIDKATLISRLWFVGTD